MEMTEFAVTNSRVLEDFCQDDGQSYVPSVITPVFSDADSGSGYRPIANSFSRMQMVVIGFEGCGSGANNASFQI